MISIDNYINNAMSPFCLVDSYDMALKIARPWVEQGYYVVLSATREEEQNE